MSPDGITYLTGAGMVASVAGYIAFSILAAFLCTCTLGIAIAYIQKRKRLKQERSCAFDGTMIERITRAVDSLPTADLRRHLVQARYDRERAMDELARLRLENVHVSIPAQQKYYEQR